MCRIRLTRREFVGRGVGAAAAFAGMPGSFRLPGLRELESSTTPRLDVAVSAWRWIDSSRVETEHGISWPADPTSPDSIGDTLYTHGTGVLPFVLELFHTTPDEEYLHSARLAADHLVGRLEAVRGSGLYVGLGGVAFVLAEVFRSTGAVRYRDAANRAADRIVARAVVSGGGVAWPQPGRSGSVEVNDIVSGTAGTGLTLLYLARALDRADLVESADRAGRRLLELGIETEGGTTWEMMPGYAREMPNFSHGTAGIAYFLARMAAETGEAVYARAAVSGARYLQSIADDTEDGYLIRHHTPGGEDLYYLSWCHGPVGTNRLFHQLHSLTGAHEWLEWVGRGARGILGTGVPEQRTPGFWENVSQCGGSAGLGDYYLTMYRMTGEERYRAFVDRLNDDLFKRSTSDADGTRWIQSEHRVQPDLLVAQTGFMQGAAGIGKYFLHLESMEKRSEGPKVILPDAPY